MDSVAIAPSEPMPVAAAVRHSCECLCATCEQHGSGFFAQRALLSGETTAGSRLAPAVVTALSTQRASHARGAKHERG